MAFDSTIHLGDLIIFIGMLGGVFVVWGRFSVIEMKVHTMWKWFEEKVLRK